MLSLDGAAVHKFVERWDRHSHDVPFVQLAQAGVHIVAELVKASRYSVLVAV